MTRWLARMFCDLDDWRCRRLRRESWLDSVKRIESNAYRMRVEYMEVNANKARAESEAHLKARQNMSAVLYALLKKYGGKIRIEQRHFKEYDPLVNIMFSEDLSHRTYELDEP
jgi:hypothetical protein